MRETFTKEESMNEKELQELRVALMLAIVELEDRMADYQQASVQVQKQIEAASTKVIEISEELRLLALVRFCNTPNLFAPVL